MKGEAMSTKGRKVKKQCFEGKEMLETLLIPNSIALILIRAIQGAPFERVFVLRWWKGAARLLCIRNPRKIKKAPGKGIRCVLYFTFSWARHINWEWIWVGGPIDECRRMWARRQFIVSTASFPTALKRLLWGFLCEISKSI